MANFIPVADAHKEIFAAMAEWWEAEYEKSGLSFLPAPKVCPTCGQPQVADATEDTEKHGNTAPIG